MIQTHIVKCLEKYFDLQNNILVLHRQMSEPMLHLTVDHDSLDYLKEMEIAELLKHPVVVEVLNYVYEGRYSISSSPLGLMRTFACYFDMEVKSLKSVSERLVQNICTIG